MSELPAGFELDQAPQSAASVGLPDGFALDDAPQQEQKPTTNNFSQILTDFQNQGMAASQGTTPFISSHAPNIVSDVVHENDAGDLLYVDPASGKMLPTDSNKQVVLRDPADGKLKVYGRTEDTDEGRLSGLGRILGTGMATGPVAGVKAVSPVVGAAERIGVDVPVGITTESPLAQFSAQVAARAPGGGPMLKAIEESKQGLRGAVDRAAEMAGGVRDPAMAGDNYAAAIEGSFKPMVKGGLNSAYENVTSLMDRSKLTPLSETQGAVADILARRGEAGIQGLGKAVGSVEEAIKRPGGLTFEGTKNLRTSIGEMLDSGVLPEGMSEGELRRIYSGLSDDLRAAAQNAGGERGVAAFERANELTKQVADWKEGVRKVIGPNSRSGEGVSGAIIRMASSGASGDVETLAKARAAVPQEVWQDIASTAINRMGISRNGEWTPAAFATDFRQLSDRGRALLFRSVGSSDVLPFLDDIAKVSQQFVDRGKLANTSGSAGHNAFYAAMGAVATGVASGSWREPLAVLGGLAGMNGLSRLLARPATVSSVARWSRVYSAFAKSPTPATQARLEIATRNLTNTAGANGVAIEPGDIMRSLQSPSNAGADENNRVPRPPISQ